MMTLQRTWPYGTTRICEVLEITTCKGQPVIVLGEEDSIPKEAHILLGVENELGLVPDDRCEIIFTEGGPRGGYWKPTQKLERKEGE